MTHLASAPSTKAHRLATPKVRQILPPSSVDMGRVAAVILGGGQGTRLFPLTATRCKPAISFGGRYRLIDVPISNCIHSNCRKIFVITQFLSSSLHQHIFQTYRFDSFCSGFIEVIPAEQKPTAYDWFQGTADAVRQNVNYFLDTPADYFLILSGDQLYNMDFHEMVLFAQQSDADLVIATLPVTMSEAKRMGILQVDKKGAIVTFCEKPQSNEQLSSLRTATAVLEERLCSVDSSRQWLGSMGIYLFKRSALFQLLQDDLREDFGKHLIPTKVQQGSACAYIYNGYWEDIGTIESFYHANMALTSDDPPFRCHSEMRPIFSRQQHLPDAKFIQTFLSQAIVCEGSIIDGCEISNSIVGPRSIIGKGTLIRSSYVMGNDFYAPPTSSSNLPESFFIGSNCLISKAVIDKHVHIGNAVRLTNEQQLQHYDSPHVYIRDGIIIVPRGASLPDKFAL